MNNKRKIAEIAMTVVLVVALLFFITIAAFQIYEAFIENGDEASSIVLGINGTGTEAFGTTLKGKPAPMGDLIGIVSGGNFTVLDKNADTKTTENFVLSDPILHSKGNFCVVADFDGDSARLYEKGKVRAKIETGEKIIAVATNANGFFAVATEETGYNAVINVYRKNGEPIYRYRIAENTFIDMDISANNRKLIVVEANLSSGTIGSNIVLVELNHANAQKTYYIPNNLYVGVHFNKNGSFVCLGNEKIDLYRADAGKVGEIEIKGRNLVNADVAYDDMIALAFKGQGESGAHLLEIYDKNGKLRGSAEFSEEIEHISVNESYIAVSHGKKVSIVRSNGKIKKSFTQSSPVKYATCFATGDAAIVFSGGNTSIVK